MRVLAIDPGYDRIGIAVLEHHAAADVLIYSNCISTNRQATLAERLRVVGDTIKQLLETYRPDTVAIETLFFNKNVKTAIGVAQARGIIIYLAGVSQCKIYEFGPQEIKVAVTGYGSSDKFAVLTMVQRLFPNTPKAAHDDEYDAIAVGITCLAHYGRRQYNPAELLT